MWSILQLILMDLAEWSTEWLVKNKSANVPIMFEEIVIVMINSVFAFLEAP